MSTAQEEFNQLVNSNRERSTVHPEDIDSDDAHFSDDESSTRKLRQSRANDSSDEDEIERNMVSSRNYHIPNTVYDNNTGPKGVIADAQAFERARKKSFRQTLLSAAGFDSNSNGIGSKTESTPPVAETSSGSDDDEDRFMRKWRASRMQELQGRNRRASPRGRRYGVVENVDAAGYLDAVEKVTPDTVVVVCIYDPLVCGSYHLNSRSPRLVSSRLVPSRLYICLTILSSVMIVPSWKNVSLPLLADNHQLASSSCIRRLRR